MSNSETELRMFEAEPSPTGVPRWEVAELLDTFIQMRGDYKVETHYYDWRLVYGPAARGRCEAFIEGYRKGAGE